MSLKAYEQHYSYLYSVVTKLDKDHFMPYLGMSDENRVYQSFGSKSKVIRSLHFCYILINVVELAT